MSTVFFLVGAGADVRGALVCCVGGNADGITWLRHRRPGVRVAKYFARLLNMRECAHPFRISSIYISARNRRRRGDFPILEIQCALNLGNSRGYTFVDVREITQNYLAGRLMSLLFFYPLIRPIMSPPSCNMSKSAFR